MYSYVLLVFLGLGGVLCDSSLRFMAIGDWGGSPKLPYDTSIEKAVAKQMDKVATEYNTSFILALGDNFYDDGVRSVDDRRFKYTFEDVYKYSSLMQPWYFVAGNHDHHGNVDAQIEYSKRSHRWNFPNYYYKLSFLVPGGRTLEIIMIDTVQLCGDSGSDDLHLQPQGPDDEKVADSQWQWIEQQLQVSKADYLLAAGHYPVFSIAEHGPTKCLTSQLKPMLLKYNATAYLSGHDHNLQHLSYTEDSITMDYFVTGAADKIDTSTAHAHSVPSGSLKFHWAESKGMGGFAYIEADAEKMTLTFFNAANQELYRYTMYPRK